MPKIFWFSWELNVDTFTITYATSLFLKSYLSHGIIYNTEQISFENSSKNITFILEPLNVNFDVIVKYD